MNTSSVHILTPSGNFQTGNAKPQQYFRIGREGLHPNPHPTPRTVAWLNITLPQSTLCVELDRFFDWLKAGEFSPTKSALVQTRQKLLPKFFKDMFLFSARCFTNVSKQTLERHALWAADGTGFRLPDEEWLGEEPGWHGNQHNQVPSCRLLAYYDLLNQILTAAQFHTRYMAETVVAQRSIAEIPRDVCNVYDRPMLHTPSPSPAYGTIALSGCPLALAIPSKPSSPAVRKNKLLPRALTNPG